jgi:hypothetical protein
LRTEKEDKKVVVGKAPAKCFPLVERREIGEQE